MSQTEPTVPAASPPAASEKCARTACQSTKATCRHTQTGRMYCRKCAHAINEANPERPGLVDIPAAPAPAAGPSELPNVWYWMGDGNDHLESLTCQVVIHAEDLRKLIAAAPSAEAGTLAEALRFYADDRNYKSPPTGPYEGARRPDVIIDGGKLAVAALASSAPPAAQPTPRPEERLVRLSEIFADDGFAESVAKQCNDRDHDNRYCPTCSARSDGINAYREALERAALPSPPAEASKPTDAEASK